MTATFSLKSGYAYRLDNDGDWEIVILPREEEHNTKVHTRLAWIDGARCVVFDGWDGMLYAQTEAMAWDQ